jgi:hypothetical protein
VMIIQQHPSSVTSPRFLIRFLRPLRIRTTAYLHHPIKMLQREKKIQERGS